MSLQPEDQSALIEKLNQIARQAKQEDNSGEDQVKEVSSIVSLIIANLSSMTSIPTLMAQKVNFDLSTVQTVQSGSPITSKYQEIATQCSAILNHYFGGALETQYKSVREQFALMLGKIEEEDTKSGWWKSSVKLDTPSQTELSGRNFYSPIPLKEFQSTFTGSKQGSFVLGDELLPDEFILKTYNQSPDQLNQLMEDSVRSEGELRKQYSTMLKRIHDTKFRLKYPSYEEVKETRLFSQYQRASNILATDARMKLCNYSKQNKQMLTQFDKMIGELKEMHADRLIEKDRLNQTIGRGIRLAAEQSKLQFQKAILEKLDPFNVVPYEELVKRLVELDGELTEETAKTYMNELDGMRPRIKRIRDSAKEAFASKERAVQQLLSRPKSMKHQELYKAVTEKRDQMKQTIESINNIMATKTRDIDTIISEMESISNDLKVPSPFISYFDTISDDMVFTLAQKDYNQKEIDELNSSISQHEARISKMKEDMEKIQQEVTENENKIQIGKENEKNGIIPKKQVDAAVEELRLMYICPVCHQRQRDCYLPCGHTFCRVCSEALIKKRNRHCPSCNYRIEKKDIMSINW